MHTKYLFIVNPLSGAGKGEIIGRLLKAMLPEHPALKEGIGQVFMTNELDSAMLGNLLSSAQTVVAVGGDGTVYHLLPDILKCASPLAIGLIPLGTSNDLARALGVSAQENYADEKTLRIMLDKLLNARREELDVLTVNGKMFFCNYFSIGLDAAIVCDFDSERKSRWVRMLPPGRITNNFLYFLMGLKNAGFYLKPPIELTWTDQGREHHIQLDMRIRALIFSNLPFYAGGCHICPDARKDDGVFEITIIRKTHHFLALIGTRFLPFLRVPHGVSQYRTREVAVKLPPLAPCQIDGEKVPNLDGIASPLHISFHRNLCMLALR